MLYIFLGFATLSTLEKVTTQVDDIIFLSNVDHTREPYDILRTTKKQERKRVKNFAVETALIWN